jgi:hypothetical protein
MFFSQKEKVKKINFYVIKYLKLRKFSKWSLSLGYLNFFSPLVFREYDYEKIFENNISNFSRKIKKNFNILEKSKNFLYKKKKFIKFNIKKIYFSYIINENINEIKKKDFYFTQDNKKFDSSDYLFVYLNLSNTQTNLLQKKYSNFKNIIILDDNINFFLEIFNLFKIILHEGFYSIFLYFFTKDKFFKNFLIHIFSFTSLRAGLYNLRISFQIINILKFYRPSKFYYLYEGKLLEALLIEEIKKLNLSIQCFGYQHSTITNSHYGLLRQKYIPFQPTKVLTVGKLNKQILKKFNIDATIVGSNKYIENKMPFKNLLEFKKKNHKLTCLILPQASEEEIMKFIDLANYLLKKIKNIQIIWRHHPSFNLTANNYFNDLKKYKNFFISQKSLKNESKLSNICVYRGSAAVIQACSYGVIPIYYNIRNDFKLDSIELCQTKHKSLNKVEILEYLTQLFILVKKKEYINEIKVWCDFHKKFYEKYKLI